jgi:Na+-translocating ferredoxin:NAD+ oxidoreductase RnfD subunit/NAD-dependent dihydropyrimidine dehydrogenase PreA subunit
MSKEKEYSGMTKDKLMTYTFVALLVIAVITIVMWWDVTALDVMTLEPIGMQYGLTVLINCLIAVGLAVGIDLLLNKVASDSPLNLMSAAVFGLIVSLSYTVGEPVMRATEVMPLFGPDAFLYVALITVVGMILFKKLQSVAGRKYVNPAVAAKLVVLGIAGLLTILIPADHLITGGLQVPSLAGPISYDIVSGNGAAGFGFYLVGCFANPASPIPSTVPTQGDIFNLLFLEKFHGWAGGASSIAVIIVGIALFVLARRYIKWRITLAYFVSVSIMAVLLNFAYPGGDLLLRLGFELFIGSSIFLAFFMATDPATTPITYTGQLIFGSALGVLTVLIQTYMGFFGGSILALLVMNLTSPFLDRVGKLKATTESKEPKLPKAKSYAPEKVKTYDCIRCGACMRVCCHKLSPILIKQAFDKMDVEALSKLNADYCTGCGHCSYVCPSRIDLKGSVLRSKALLRKQ